MTTNAGAGELGLPAVSVVMPCRNEAGFIQGAVGSILKGDYAGRLELIVADGMSDDGTRGIVLDMAKNDPRVKLIDNPGRIVPTAMNAGISAAKGEVIIRADAHTRYAPDYVAKCVEYLRATGADNVGGAMRVVAKTPFERAVALATGCRFGVGNSRFHFPDHEGYVDTVYLGAYRKDVFERIGGFDEELVRNQDDELNYRLVRSGGRIYMARAIKSWYHPRSSAAKLWRQYFGYGFYKVRVIAKHGTPASARHLVPGAFVFSLLALPPIGAAFRPALWIAAAVMLAYFSLAAAFTARLCLARGGDKKLAPMIPAVFALMHVGYGAGFIKGVLDGAARHWARGLKRRTARAGRASPGTDRAAGSGWTL